MKDKFLTIAILVFLIFSNTGCLFQKVTHKGWYRQFGIQSEAELQNISNLPKLIKALNSPDEYTKLLAIHHIKLFGKKAKKAGPALTELIIYDRSEEVKIRATLAIGEILYDDSKVVNAIATNLASIDNSVLRKYSAHVLGKLKNPTREAVEALKNSMKHDKHSAVREVAGISYYQLSELSKNNFIKSGDKHLVNVNGNKLIHIAIAELDAINMPLNTIDALSNRLNLELFESKNFIVLERQKMKDILKEQEFQLSGCTDNECIVEMGKLLNVQQMLAGSVARIGRIYSINLRLIDVQSGKITSSAIEDIDGGIEKVLTRGIRNSVNKLITNLKF